MIELLSVRLENFRSFTDATFVPAPSGEGLTAITGRNGAGKSSIIHALMWALYGETPNDVPVKGLRRQGSTEPVQVRVVFRHDGQTVTITRSLRGKNDTGAVNIEVDGVQQTTVSVRTAKQWVTDRLRLDSAAFLTAFVVRQKELDALLTDRPTGGNLWNGWPVSKGCGTRCLRRGPRPTSMPAPTRRCQTPRVTLRC